MTITFNRITSAFLIVAFAYAILSIPGSAHATMLGPCDHLNSWSTLRVGDKDTNISDIGPIAGLQQMIDEPDLRNQRMDDNAIGLPLFENGFFDNGTKRLLIEWQVKHGIITLRSDAEAGVVGEKTLAVAKNYCGGATNARGDIIMSGPMTTYTFYYPLRGGGFGSEMSIPLPKYTQRVADQALRALFMVGPQGQSQCNDMITGKGLVLDTNPACRFSPFSSDTLGRSGYQAKDINGKDVNLTNAYRGVTVENSVATVSFNQVALPFFDNAAVSPLVRGAIERTLKQFPTISQVRFEVITFHDAAAPTKQVFDENSVSTGTDVSSKIASLLAQIKMLQDLLVKLQGGTSGSGQTSSSGLNCLALTYDLWIGKGDAETSGEVSKLQQFLTKEGVYPEGVVSGYYGNLTAQAVVRWQKAHGMDFVTTKSGVGPMTRERMKVCGVW